MEKFIKFGDFITKELVKDYELAGHRDRIEFDKVHEQARVIAKELCDNYPNLTLSYLHLLPKIIRKRGERINWQSIVKALNSPEYQDDLKNLIEQEKASRPRIENKEEYYTVLEQSVLSWMVEQEIPFKNFKCSVEEYHKIFWSNMDRIRNLSLDYVEKLKANGWQDHQQFKGLE